MDLVVDANVLFSVLIKDNFSYNILFNGKDKKLKEQNKIEIFNNYELSKISGHP